MIESFSFGEIIINGRNYKSDLIIYPHGRVMGSWWRKEGHRLFSGDISELIDSKPEIIVIGTGASGLMQPTEELLASLKECRIECIIQPTQNAMDIFNSLFPEKKVGACFHLTC
ncbi:Mth938-like domain-containing protein [Thermodesulfobacteriota bacterium]